MFVTHMRSRRVTARLRCVTAAAAAAVDGTQLRMVINRNDLTAAVGANVTFICTVAGTNWNFFFNQIIWYKVSGGV